MSLQTVVRPGKKVGSSEAIGTQIFEADMPSQLDFDSNKRNNPEEISWGKTSAPCLKQFNVRGRGIFDISPKYRRDQVIDPRYKKYQVKAFNDSPAPGLKQIWESVLGYAKRELAIEDGQVYVVLPGKNGSICSHSHKLTNLLKIFIDTEAGSIRLVFRDEDHEARRISRDYQPENLSELAQKIILECNALGLQVIQDDI